MEKNKKELKKKIYLQIYKILLITIIILLISFIFNKTLALFLIGAMIGFSFAVSVIVYVVCTNLYKEKRFKNNG